MSHRDSHINSLDGLRGLAALLVVVSHSSNVSGLWGYRFGLGTGQFGVMVFFILSGFLMGYLYAARAWDSTNIKKFAMARVARVLPLYYALVLASYLVQIGVLGYVSDYVHAYKIDNSNILDHVFLLEGTSVFWTIPVEIHFYILFPFIWLLRRTSQIGLYFILGLVLLVATASVFPKFGNQSALSGYLHLFVLGFLISEIYRSATVEVTGIDALLCNSLFVLFLIGLPFALPHNFKLTFGYGYPISKSFVPIIYCTLLMLLCLYAPLARTLLGNRVMKFMGSISYSLYLLHGPVLNTIGRYFDARAQPLVFLMFVLAASTALSALSFHYLERPIQRWLRGIVSASV